MHKIMQNVILIPACREKNLAITTLNNLITWELELVSSKILHPPAADSG
jgi:hypothetical protein